MSGKGSGTGKGFEKGKGPSTQSDPIIIDSDTSDDDEVVVTSVTPAPVSNLIPAPSTSLAITGSNISPPIAGPSSSGNGSIKASVSLVPLFGPNFIPLKGRFNLVFVQKGPNRHRIYTTHPSPHCEICRLRLTYHTHRKNSANLLHTRLTHIHCRHATPNLCHRLADRSLRREIRHLEAKLIAFLEAHSTLHPGCVTVTDKPF